MTHLEVLHAHLALGLVEEVLDLPARERDAQHRLSPRAAGRVRQEVLDLALDPDDNEAERAIRPVAIGRKNGLFCGSDNGGRTAAVPMAICANCKQHGVNTLAYIRDMLVRVSTEPASRIRELLPDRWKPSAMLLPVKPPPPAPRQSYLTGEQPHRKP
ncbi:MAG: IS66 family transposase [Planctomycetota bacterium]